MTLDEIPWLHPEEVVLAKFLGTSPHCANCRHWKGPGAYGYSEGNYRGCDHTLIDDRLTFGTMRPTCPHFQLGKDDEPR
jgi:hypothetical protein